jgi:hypothetical protein
MPIFGITASSNMSTKLTDFYQIATTTVGSGGIANIDFTSIPQDYTHLQIRGIISGTGNDLRLRFNSDSGSNYTYHYVYGDGATAAAGASSATDGSYIGYVSNTSNATFTFVTDILDYKNTNKFKTIRTINGQDLNGSGLAMLSSSHWRSTTAVTSVRLLLNAGNIGQFSSIQLYGVKA